MGNLVPKVFVIVVTYKGKRWYDRCFSSLRESAIPVQTIVVDNASNDGTAEYIKEHFPEIHLIESQENLGFGRANNIAMRYALDNGCDYVFLLNQDTWIETNSIADLVAIHESNPRYGILSPMHVRADGKSLYMQIIDGNENNPNKRLISDLYCNNLKSVYSVIYVNAAAWLLPRKTLETVGGFDPIYVHYAEDNDYANRVLFRKLLIGVCPQVRIIHDHQSIDNPLTPEGGKARHNQMLTLKLTDPNANMSVGKFERYCLKKCIKTLLSGNVKSYKKFYSDLCFVVSNKKKIKESARLKRESKMPWL